MSSIFCTIITSDYLFYALALRDSLCSFDPAVKLHVLIADSTNSGHTTQTDAHNIKFHKLETICTNGIGHALHAKYHHDAMDRFRWSMKPVFLNYLFQRERISKAVYVDADICFFDRFDFLFQELDSANVLLSPHWRSSDAVVDAPNFEKNLTEGLFNGGCVGATAKGTHILDWWAHACLYECVRSRERGLYDDQKYLDMMPIFFEGVTILRHRGCNVAEWNAIECKRTATDIGQVLINGVDPVVFIHFTPWLYRRVLCEDDVLLKPYVEKYVASLRKYKPDFQVTIPEAAPVPTAQTGFLNKLRRRTRRLTTQFWNRLANNFRSLVKR